MSTGSTDMTHAPLGLSKAHAYGNDFLYVRASTIEKSGVDPVGFAVATCRRQTGIGADGLIVFSEDDAGATMRLINADGSHSEVSGNGVRALGALLARQRGWSAADAGRELVVRTDAGPKRLRLLDAEGARFAFRAEMGVPRAVERVVLDVAGERIDAVRLDIGNPQCVTFGPLDEDRLARLGRALQVHQAFPEAVNFELAQVENRGVVRILIWERGVGRTESSGTGSCAAAVAAMTLGLTERAVEVVAPGGSQRVEWTDDGVLLTGWAEVLFEGTWVADAHASGSLHRR